MLFRSHIHVMRNAHGDLMDDIRTGDDNHDAANFITAQVRQFSADPACALHVSIAGGRKTMGFYLGYALSLYGRPQDRLSHVLVSEPFESSQGFFYPTPYSQVLETRGGKLVDTATAVVNLAVIPFVSLRHATAMVDGNASFDETVQAARKALAPAHLTLDLRGRRILAGDQVVTLSPTNLAMLAVFARRASQGDAPLRAPSLVPEATKEKEGSDREWSERFLLEYRRISGSDSLAALACGMDGTYFSERKSKLERSLNAALGPTASAYCIKAFGPKNSRLYALDLPKEAVVFGSFLAPRENK